MLFRTGGFWDKGIDSKREHCYRIIPLSISRDAREMTLHAFDLVYQSLGKLGYRFKDAGHNHENVVVSLDKQISKRHLRQLEGAFSIQEDAGKDLAFA